MKKIIVGICFVLMIPMAASAWDYAYFDEVNLIIVPKLILRMDKEASSMSNPALLDLKSDYEVIIGPYYQGNSTKISTNYSHKIDPSGISAPDAYSSGNSRGTYTTNIWGTDLGFALKLNDLSSLGLVFNYENSTLKGNEDFSTSWDLNLPFINSGYFDGAIDRDVRKNTFSLAALYDLDISDTLSLGAGLKYAYITEKHDDDMYGTGVWEVGSIPETADTDLTVKYGYHLVRPMIGLSSRPMDVLSLNASVSPGFRWGTVDRDGSYYDDIFGPAGFGLIPAGESLTNTEDLKSHDLFGWDIDASVQPTFIMNDALSFPVLVKFYYGDFGYNLDGPIDGYFATYDYPAVFRGPGSIEYDVSDEFWYITAGPGVDYSWKIFDFSSMVSYTRCEFSHTYDQVNNVVSSLVFIANPIDGLTFFHQQDKLVLDVISVDLGVAGAFSDAFSASFGVTYDFGWAARKYSHRSSSPYISPEGTVQTITMDKDTDTYQDLTLNASLSYRPPINGLMFSLSGMVKIPLEKMAFDMDGSTTYNVDTTTLGFFWPYGLGDPTYRGYSSQGWDYGGMLNVTYEF